MRDPGPGWTSLRRRILWLVSLGLATILIAGTLVRLFEREGRRINAQIAEFHGPTLVAVQEALLALSELRREDVVPHTGNELEAGRQRRRLLNEIAQHLTSVVELQRTYQWTEAAATVQRINQYLTDIDAAIGASPTTVLPAPPPRLELSLDQLRLLHQEEENALLRGRTARGTTYFRVVAPLLLVLLSVGTTLIWLVWRGIGHSLATETALRDGLMTEINERRQVEAELRLKDTAIATSINGIVIANASGTIVYANPAFLAMWRIADAGSLATLSTTDLWRGDAHDAGLAHRPPEPGWLGEVTAVRTDGSTFPALLSCTAVRDPQGEITHVMASFIDLTEARAVQEQLIQSQKLESVGRLAGGVAHDFNNLLLVIKGYVEMAQAEVPEGSTIGRYLLEVSRAAESAAALTSQMLTLSRRQIITPTVLDLNAVVQRVHGMLRRVLGEDIHLQVQMAADLWRIRFDPGQAEQILLNLAVNARDAMPTGGKLTLETANVHLDEDYVREHPGVAAGDYVMLAVSDTGSGMSRETLEHAFEPFYTTKTPGHGTGLGLAIIHGAVSQNGGRVELYSEAGHGTTVKIYLPRTLDPERPASAASGGQRPVGHETILLVEDDAAVRVLATRLLERQGYQVHAFAEPAGALAWLRQTPTPIHLLFTDVIMPGMNGKELAAQVLALRPGTKVLYVSGYTANVIVLHGVLKPGTEFLAKPYTHEALATRVRQVLDGGGENWGI